MPPMFRVINSDPKKKSALRQQEQRKSCGLFGLRPDNLEFLALSDIEGYMVQGVCFTEEFVEVDYPQAFQWTSLSLAAIL